MTRLLGSLLDEEMGSAEGVDVSVGEVPLPPSVRGEIGVTVDGEGELEELSVGGVRGATLDVSSVVGKVVVEDCSSLPHSSSPLDCFSLDIVPEVLSVVSSSRSGLMIGLGLRCRHSSHSELDDEDEDDEEEEEDEDEDDVVEADEDASDICKSCSCSAWSAAPDLPAWSS